MFFCGIITGIASCIFILEELHLKGIYNVLVY